MRKALKRRFWFETSIAVATGVMFMITLVWRDWIELIFKADPDQSSGLLEWLIVGSLLVVTITLLVLARYEWRKARVAIG